MREQIELFTCAQVTVELARGRTRSRRDHASLVRVEFVDRWHFDVDAIDVFAIAKALDGLAVLIGRESRERDVVVDELSEMSE